MECDSNKQRRLNDQKINESYNLPNTCMSFSTKSKKMIIFRWKKSAFRQQMVKRVLTESLYRCPCNQGISLRQWRILKTSKGVAVMVKTEFLRHIRGNVTSFLTLSVRNYFSQIEFGSNHSILALFSFTTFFLFEKMLSTIKFFSLIFFFSLCTIYIFLLQFYQFQIFYVCGYGFLSSNSFIIVQFFSFSLQIGFSLSALRALTEFNKTSSSLISHTETHKNRRCLCITE